MTVKNLNDRRKRVRIGHLQTIGDLLREMKRVYKAAQKGDIKTEDMTRFTNCLNTIINAQRDSDLERRLEELELILNGDRVA